MEPRTATEADAGAIRGVQCAAFGRAAEAELVDVLRAEGVAAISLVAFAQV